MCSVCGADTGKSERVELNAAHFTRDVARALPGAKRSGRENARVLTLRKNAEAERDQCGNCAKKPRSRPSLNRQPAPMRSANPMKKKMTRGLRRGGLPRASM